MHITALSRSDRGIAMAGVLSSVNSEVEAGKSLAKSFKKFITSPKVKEFFHNHWVGIVSIVLTAAIITVLVGYYKHFIPAEDLILYIDQHDEIIAETISDKMDKYFAKNDEINGMILRTQLLQLYTSYIDRGWCSAAEKEIYSDFYENYKALGFNHIQDYHLEMILALPETNEGV